MKAHMYSLICVSVAGGVIVRLCLIYLLLLTYCPPDSTET